MPADVCELPALSSDVFEQDARVLAYHGPMIYEAKVRLKRIPREIASIKFTSDALHQVLKKEDKGGILRYFLHYQGWSKKWDEWVDGRYATAHTIWCRRIPGPCLVHAPRA
jgi:hypothetical protein